MHKILHTIETRGPGGAEILMLNIAKYMHRKGQENYGLFIKRGWLEERFSEEGYGHIFHDLNRGFDIKFLYRYVSLVKRKKIDLIHSHEFTMAFYSALVSFLTGVNAVTTIHGMNYHSDTRKRQLMMKFVANYTKMVTVSEEVRTHICSSIGVDHSEIQLIENGIEYPTTTTKGNLKKELNIPENCLLIGSVGRLHRVKGYKYLIEASKIVLQKEKKIYFAIAGDGNERPLLKNQIKLHGLENKIFLLGTRSDVPNILSSIDIFVLPSLSEGTSLALLEAMSYGLPIVATDVGNNSNLIKSDKNGYLIQPQNPNEIAEKLLKIIKNDQLDHYYSVNRNLIKNNYSFDIMIDKYQKIYRK